MNTRTSGLKVFPSCDDFKKTHKIKSATKRHVVSNGSCLGNPQRNVFRNIYVRLFAFTGYLHVISCWLVCIGCRVVAKVKCAPSFVSALNLLSTAATPPRPSARNDAEYTQKSVGSRTKSSAACVAPCALPCATKPTVQYEEYLCHVPGCSERSFNSNYMADHAAMHCGARPFVCAVSSLNVGILCVSYRSTSCTGS